MKITSTIRPSPILLIFLPLLDVDECKETNFICGLDGICMNKNGSYDCVCPEGQSQNPRDNRCEGKEPRYEKCNKPIKHYRKG